MNAITTCIVKHVPYIGPVISMAGLALDVKEIIEIATLVGAAKIITGRLLNECTPPELLIGGKCVMLVGSVVASIATGGSLLVITRVISAARSIIRD